MNNPFLEAALLYREKFDLSIIPMVPGEKRASIKWKEFQTRKPTIEEIRQWWKESPNSNIGIITGKLNNICVVDFDKYAEGYSEETAGQYFSDSLIAPTVDTPRGGQHLYFQYPEENLTINSGAIPGIDFRGEGGIITVPPSVNGNGKAYAWVEGLSFSDVKRPPLPFAYIKALINKSTIYGGVTSNRDNSVTCVTERDIWKDGVRDENLFHIAHCLTQTKNSEDYILQTLRAIVLSWGEVNEKWIDAKIKSAMERDGRQERNIQAMFDAWVRDTERDWNVTMCDKELGIVTKRDMDSRRKAISRRKDVTIEKAGTKEGWWRRIDTDIVFMDFDEPEGIEYPVLLPFELNNLVKICQGNIILVAGEYNAGKSTFALNVLVNNKNRVPIRYMSSEMKVGELKDRFKGFGLRKEDYWPDDNCRYVELKNNITSLLLPNGLNIIDYLEFPNGDYTLGGEYMRQIHDKLTTGVAIVCNQQKEGQRLPRSGDLILEKPRLALTLRKISTENDDIVGFAEILKAKNVTIGKMDGKKLKYQIMDKGSRFKTLINWGWWRL